MMPYEMNEKELVGGTEIEEATEIPVAEAPKFNKQPVNEKAEAVDEANEPTDALPLQIERGGCPAEVSTRQGKRERKISGKFLVFEQTLAIKISQVNIIQSKSREILIFFSGNLIHVEFSKQSKQFQLQACMSQYNTHLQTKTVV